MRLILLELNEVNIDAVKTYLDEGKHLPNFEALINGHARTTTAECAYEQLEPWIQWPSVHTGLTYQEHTVFRLGDFANLDHAPEQVFELAEKMGFHVGAVSPMNAVNRLRSPAYFLPDPWTQTPSDESWINKKLTKALVQAVNDNAKAKLSMSTLLYLGISFLHFVPVRRYRRFLSLTLRSMGRPWRKALFLDLFLHEVHKTLFGKHRADFSTLFLNAGAHIQHHYFFNSAYVKDKNLSNPHWYVADGVDPFGEMLEIYDLIVGDLLRLRDTELLVVTGLSQRPFTDVKYMYRPRDHAGLLQLLGIKRGEVVPRMTSDFVIKFNTVAEADHAAKRLTSVKVNNSTPLFGHIDNRGRELFVMMDYPHYVDDETTIEVNGTSVSLASLVVFVCIKNGEHQSRGFAFASSNIGSYLPDDGAHVSKLHQTIVDILDGEGGSRASHAEGSRPVGSGRETIVAS